ncbi:MAG: YqeG family HAD IIIA-type phosphatase [Prochlorotrichaceae cyanobacterium]
MSWTTLLRPNLIVQGTILALTPERVAQHGLRGLILDVDETLLPSSAGQVSPELKAWVDAFRPDVKLWLVTNNVNLPRIRRISEELNIPFFVGAAKPSRRKLRKAVEAMNLPIDQLGIVGDRLFTDVLGGNRLGLFTILVDPIYTSQSTTKGHPYWVRRLELMLSKILGMKIHE